MRADQERVVVISAEGETSFLYEDGHPLLGLASASIERVSDVEWDEDVQAWTVRFRDPFGHLNAQCSGRFFPVRQDALDFEVDTFLSDARGE